MPLYRFRIDGPLLKSIVNAYRQLGVEFFAHFTHEGVFITQMDMSHVLLLDLRLTPRDFDWFTPDEVWVTADDKILWDAVKRYKKGDVAVVEVRDDRGLWVGDLKIGRVVEEEEVYKYEGPLPKVDFTASFRVVTADFSRIVKNALADRANKIGIYVDRPECLFMFLDDKVSRVDASREDWLLGCSGKASAFYELDSFSKLLFPALSPSVEASLAEDLPILLKYSNAEFELKYWLAPRSDTQEMKALFKAPKPERVSVFEMGKKLVEELLDSLKAINPLLGGALPKMAPLYQMGLYVYWSNKYQIGSLKLAYERFETFRDIGERLSSELRMTDIIPFLKNVETLELYLEKEGDERKFVFVGRGPKIAEKELVLEAHRGIDVPKVDGVGVFSGPNNLLRRTVEDTKLCEDDYLVFYTTAYDIVAFGENHVYYSATFELDSFKPLEEAYLAIKPEFFDNLITFFRNIPTVFTVLGRKDQGIYLSSSNQGLQVEAYLYQSEDDVKKAVERYQERIKPKPPVEVKPIEVAPPKTLEEQFQELRVKVSALNKEYEEVSLKFREEEEKFYKVEKKPELKAVKSLIAALTEIEPKLEPLKTRYESLKTQLLELYKLAKLELMREIDRVVGGEINPNLRNIDFFKGRIIYLLPQLRRMEKELEVVPPVAPPPPKPPPKPKPVTLKPEEVEEVWKEFAAYARTIDIIEPLVYRDEFDEVVRTAVSVAQATERARKLADRIKKRITPPPPPPAPPVAVLPEDMAEVYRRLKLPYGARISDATFQTVWYSILRERVPPAGLISSELDYLWREFSGHLQRYGLDAEKYRRDFDEVVDRTLNLDENTEAVMRRAREITEPFRKP